MCGVFHRVMVQRPKENDCLFHISPQATFLKVLVLYMFCILQNVNGYIESHNLYVQEAASSPDGWILSVLTRPADSKTVKIYPDSDHDASYTQRG